MKLFLTLVLFFLVYQLAFCQVTIPDTIPSDTFGKILFYWGVTATCLLGLSEGLSLIPNVKSNGIFQLIVNIIKALAGKK